MPFMGVAPQASLQGPAENPRRIPVPGGTEGNAPSPPAQGRRPTLRVARNRSTEHPLVPPRPPLRGGEPPHRGRPPYARPDLLRELGDAARVSAGDDAGRN